MFDWERDHFFGGGWTCAAHGSRLPAAGDQLAVETGKGGALIVRGEDGHQGVREHLQAPRPPTAPVRPDRERARPSSARTTRGRTRCPASCGARRDTGTGFDASAWPLRELPAVEWHGLVFVDGSGGAAGPLPLSRLDPIVAPYEPSRLVVAATHTYDAAANWKILTENYHECYHCPTIHPELCSVSPPHSGENYESSGAWIGGWMELRDGAATMSLDGHSDGVPLRGLPATSCGRWPTSGSSRTCC